MFGAGLTGISGFASESDSAIPSLLSDFAVSASDGETSDSTEPSLVDTELQADINSAVKEIRKASTYLKLVLCILGKL
jgi:hypothetical protein